MQVPYTQVAIFELNENDLLFKRCNTKHVPYFKLFGLIDENVANKNMLVTSVVA